MLQLHSLRPWISARSPESNLSSYKRSPFRSESIENMQNIQSLSCLQIKVDFMQPSAVMNGNTHMMYVKISQLMCQSVLYSSAVKDTVQE